MMVKAADSSSSCFPDQDSNSSSKSNNNNNNSNINHVVIVGAGMAGLTCARELLLLHQNKNTNTAAAGATAAADSTAAAAAAAAAASCNSLCLTILEADDRIGGRLRGNNDNNNDTNNNEWILDVGAEFIHGSGTLLTDLIDELRQDGFWKKEDDEENNNNNNNTTHKNNDNFLEEIFVTSHADGGPDEHPTCDHGKYGMYYVNHKLLLYNDPYLQPLNDALQDILSFTNPKADKVNKDEKEEKDVSMADALRQYNLSPPLMALAEASFANTAAGPLQDLSVYMLTQFEQHWEQNEIAGDYRIQNFALHSIVEGLMQKLQQLAATAAAANKDAISLQIHTNSKVTSIMPSSSQPPPPQQQQQQHASSSSSANSNNTNKLLITTLDGRVYANVDAVVVTIPPPAYQDLNVQDFLSDTQQQALLTYTGFESHMIKLVVQLDKCLWPTAVQSAICAEQIIPELWFRTITNTCNTEKETMWLATAFLTSKAAQEFVALVAKKVQEDDDDDCEGSASASNNDMRSRTDRFQERAVHLFLQQLSTIFDVPLTEWQDALKDSFYCDWKDHPYVQGGYMYPRVGLTPQHLQQLATPCTRAANVFLAGEATNTHACCTVQAAMETGVRAARQVYECLGLCKINKPNQSKLS